MTAFGIIKTEIPLDAGLSVAAGFISSEVNVFILQAAPETLDETVSTQRPFQSMVIASLVD